MTTALRRRPTTAAMLSTGLSIATLLGTLLVAESPAAAQQPSTTVPRSTATVPAPSASPSATRPAQPVPTATPSATVPAAPVVQTEPPKPVDKVMQDKPVVVEPTSASKPAPDTTSPTAPSTAKTKPDGVETVAPGPSPITTTGALSAPPPDAPPPNSPDARPTAPKERYYMMIFGSQGSPKRAKYTHTWLTIVKAVPDKDDGEKFDLTSHTISWLPRTLNVRVLALRAECGVNLSLKQTLNTVISNGECVAMWGPYELDPIVAPQLYDKVLRQIARLDSGRVLYKAIDPDHGTRSTYVSNCMHAVSDLDGVSRRGVYDEVRYFGFAASANVAGILINSGRVDSGVTHEWVAEALGLNCYRIQRRMIIPCKPPQQPVAAPSQVVAVPEAAAKSQAAE